MIPVPERVKKAGSRYGEKWIPFIVAWSSDNDLAQWMPDLDHYSQERWMLCAEKHLCCICGERLGKHLYFVLRRENMQQVPIYFEPPAHLECICWALQEQLLYTHRFDIPSDPNEDLKWAAAGWTMKAILIETSHYKVGSMNLPGGQKAFFYTGPVRVSTPVGFDAESMEGMMYVAMDRTHKLEKEKMERVPMSVRAEAYERAYVAYLGLSQEMKDRVGKNKYQSLWTVRGRSKSNT